MAPLKQSMPCRLINPNQHHSPWLDSISCRLNHATEGQHGPHAVLVIRAVEPEADEVDDVNAYSTEDVSAAFKRQASKTMRRLLLDEGLRSDGRAPGDIRPIWSAAGLLPKVRVSAVCVYVCVRVRVSQSGRLRFKWFDTAPHATALMNHNPANQAAFHQHSN